MCEDPIVKLLQQYGYSLVRLPRAGVVPGQLIIRSHGAFVHVGHLSELLLAGESVLPSVETGHSGIQLGGTASSRMGAGFALALLGDFVAAFGGSRAATEASYIGLKRFRFVFGNIEQERLGMVELDRFLADAEVDPRSRYLADILEAEDLYVITDTLKTRTLSIEASSGRDLVGTFDLASAQKAIGGSLEIQRDARQTSVISYSGTHPITFGFKACQLVYEEGLYRRLKIHPAGSGEMRSASDTVETANLTSRSPFISIQ